MTTAAATGGAHNAGVLTQDNVTVEPQPEHDPLPAHRAKVERLRAHLAGASGAKASKLRAHLKGAEQALVKAEKGAR